MLTFFIFLPLLLMKSPGAVWSTAPGVFFIHKVSAKITYHELAISTAQV